MPIILNLHSKELKEYEKSVASGGAQRLVAGPG